MTEKWIKRGKTRKQSFYNLAFLLLFETLFTYTTKHELSEYTNFNAFLHKLDLEIQSFENSVHRKENERLETLDASLAANIIQARLKHIQGELDDLDEIRGSDLMQEAKERKTWCT